MIVYLTCRFQLLMFHILISINQKLFKMQKATNSFRQLSVTNPFIMPNIETPQKDTHSPLIILRLACAHHVCCRIKVKLEGQDIHVHHMGPGLSVGLCRSFEQEPQFGTRPPRWLCISCVSHSSSSVCLQCQSSKHVHLLHVFTAGQLIVGS